MRSLLEQELPRTSEVVVVGGGIVGVACAEALARLGAGVVLIEKDQLAGGCSGACEGDVLLSDKEPGPELDLGRAGQRLYPDLAQRLTLDIELERKGALIVNLTPEGQNRTIAYAQRMRDAGVRVETVSTVEARELEPALSPAVTGGVFFPDDLQVWPMNVVFGMALAARAAGGRIVCGTRVDAIDVKDGAVTGVHTAGGSMQCRSVVVAAGAASGGLLATCGVRLPLATRKGQIVVTEPHPGLIHRKVFDAGYADTVHGTTEGLQVSTVLETTHRGNVLIGSSRDATDRDWRARIGVSALLIERAIAFVPQLGSIRAIRSYAGFRPYLPDALPAIGCTRGVDGLIVATGHEGAGINLGPITGELVADIYAGREPRVDIGPFDPNRFEQNEGPRPAAGTRPDAGFAANISATGPRA